MTDPVSYHFKSDVHHFPFNVIDELEIALQELAPHTDPVARDGVRIYKRPLNDGSDNETIGIWPDFWDPQQDTVEMKGMGPVKEPTRHRYPISIQAQVRDIDEQPGMARASCMAALIRQELYRSEHLEAVLPTLEADLGQYIERLTSYYPEGQTYSRWESHNDFVFLVTTTFIAETEIK